MMPRNRDEYTSLVIRARTIATTGGSRDQTWPATTLLFSAPPSAKATVIRMEAKANRTNRNLPNCVLRGELITILLFNL